MAGLNLAATDTGGELDPLGADLLGNPLGGLMYSTGLPRGDNTTIQQVRSWNKSVSFPLFSVVDFANSANWPSFVQGPSTDVVYMTALSVEDSFA